MWGHKGIIAHVAIVPEQRVTSRRNSIKSVTESAPVHNLSTISERNESQELSEAEMERRRRALAKAPAAYREKSDETDAPALTHDEVLRTWGHIGHKVMKKGVFLCANTSFSTSCPG